MGWFEGGEGSPGKGSGGGGDFNGSQLLALLLVGGFIFIMITCIGGLGFEGIGIGLAVSVLILIFLGLIYGDW